MFSFTLQATSGRARAGVLTTPHGVIHTPIFMPVGTAAAVKAITHRDLAEAGAEIILANTYHLMLRPGAELVQELGGLHGFTGWRRPFLTDSGGYQVFSLTQLRKLTEDGVAFQSHLDGSKHLLSPETSMDIQMKLGADIVMAFDECAPWPAPREVVAAAVERTTRWARRCRAAHRREDQWLFGIVQGGTHEDLRTRSLGQLRELDFPGYAIGGLSVGEPKLDMLRILDHLGPEMPEDKPRYLMGVGTPDDLWDGVARGVDMFDCVMPTRNARNGQLFTSEGKLSIRNARYRADPRPPDPACACFTCRTVSRAYLRHLHLANEMTAATLMTVHNVAYYLDSVRKMRESIVLGRFEEHRLEVRRTHAAPAPAD